MITSLILTQEEWRYALSGEGDAGELEEKGLATRDESGAVVTGAELRLIAGEYVSAEAEEIGQGVTAFRGRRFCMLIEPYALIRGALKISLFKDMAALETEIEERRGTGYDQDTR